MFNSMLIGHKIYEHNGYPIEYNLYGNKEYSVQYCGDDCMFKTLKEAKQFIDEMTKGEN